MYTSAVAEQRRHLHFQNLGKTRLTVQNMLLAGPSIFTKNACLLLGVRKNQQSIRNPFIRPLLSRPLQPAPYSKHVISHPAKPIELDAALARLAPPIAKDWSTAKELPAATPTPVAAAIDACHAAAMLPAAGPTAVKPNQPSSQPRTNEAMALARQMPCVDTTLLQLHAEFFARTHAEKVGYRCSSVTACAYVQLF